MTHPANEDNYPEEEAQRRFEAALRVALRTPHKPIKAEPRKRGKPEREPVPSAVTRELLCEGAGGRICSGCTHRSSFVS